MPSVSNNNPPSASPNPPAEEKPRPFSEVTKKEKLLYLINKIPARLISKLQVAPNRWNPERAELQGKKLLAGHSKWGVSALTALRIAFCVAAVGLIVGVIFAAPVLGIGVMSFVSIAVSTLMFTTILYNFVLLSQTLPEEHYVYLANVDNLLNDFFEQTANYRSPEQTQQLAFKNEYEQRQARKDEGQETEMSPMNAEQNGPQPPAEMMLPQGPHNQPYAPIDQQGVAPIPPPPMGQHPKPALATAST